MILAEVSSSMDEDISEKMEAICRVDGNNEFISKKWPRYLCTQGPESIDTLHSTLQFKKVYSSRTLLDYITVLNMVIVGARTTEKSVLQKSFCCCTDHIVF